ncbi:hypothetical protein DLJ53_10310 [Acuticoccus sediminis]|uniref:Uncharacterized protein n=1 Tax=Acuticoccus sediminis TaxID=2184697 RepID=A0A8B2NYZ3_9HYPH|nr:hypothetical protein [Acuticoccus sediminis]RAI01790.1 hypothetical protein DLJ53_10310 [Acuticoccus sediminis]
MKDIAERQGTVDRANGSGRSYVRAAAVVLGLAFLYVGVALGAPTPNLRSVHGEQSLQAETETRYLFASRGDARLTVAFERSDSRLPLLSGAPVITPAIADLPPSAAHAIRANAPRAPPACAAERRHAHQSRAPPSVTA